MIKFRCVLCKKKIKLPTWTVDRRLDCPHCKASILVPGPGDPHILESEGQPIYAGQEQETGHTETYDTPANEKPSKTNLIIGAVIGGVVFFIALIAIIFSPSQEEIERAKPAAQTAEDLMNSIEIQPEEEENTGSLSNLQDRISNREDETFDDEEVESADPVESETEDDIDVTEVEEEAVEEEATEEAKEEDTPAATEEEADSAEEEAASADEDETATPEEATGEASGQFDPATFAQHYLKRVTWKGKTRQSFVVLGTHNGVMYTATLQGVDLPAKGTEFAFSGILQKGYLKGKDFTYDTEGKPTQIDAVYLRLKDCKLVTE